MIDIKILRDTPEIVKNAVKVKSANVDVDRLIVLDKEHRELISKVEQLRAEKNKLSKLLKSKDRDSQTIEASKKIKEELVDFEEQLKVKQKTFYDLYKLVPNIPTDDSPIGYTEEENVVVKTWGELPSFSFKPKNHFEIAEHKGWIDKERAAKVAGARFAYLKGDLVKLQLALMTWVMDKLSDEVFLNEIVTSNNLSVSTKPFEPVLPPYMIRTGMYDAMDRLEPSEDRYKIEGTDQWLQGSAEHVLGSMHAGEIFEERELPIRYIGYATSFRKEAGSAGKDMEGIIRLHQFDKLEMETFSSKETSHDEHLFLSAIQEKLMQLLELPYQKLQKCTFDIGKPNAKGSDIEVWLPGQDKYRETHTADYMTDYQARRLNTRVRKAGDKSLEFVHTNDATAFACGRALVAIIENNQKENMDVEIPKELQPYVRKTVI
ncbi:Serine--tRNA ligase [Pseudoalteromonas holothuriae]|uniref:Serine--tRNA ligase n=1 Tax=Pseudoalteromonas holothuriae TaxID=2963714 RepID=A0ABM9GPW8_9GAMM|nr:serine--tRNA ligase [Pseudoalteromonas sp. CIP111951]CAH9068397.1 Serine--tRNA ligase [Pseudoalteromonas sp. CIP111951]